MINSCGTCYGSPPKPAKNKFSEIKIKRVKCFDSFYDYEGTIFLLDTFSSDLKSKLKTVLRLASIIKLTQI